MTPEPVPSARSAGRDALLAFAAVFALVAVLVRVNITLPAIGHVGSALVSLVFLYVPIYLAGRRGEDLAGFGLTTERLARSVVIAGIAVCAMVLLFTAVFIGFYELVCHSASLAQLAPHRMCARYAGLAGLHAPAIALFEVRPPRLDTLSLEWCVVQWLVVGLPEELFFRGFLLASLERRFPPRRRLLGGGVGLALVLSALAFAAIHLPREGDPRALATFFPGLLFGWMRSATGSIVASTVAHGSANILARTLEIAFTR